jgi:hypothetical protein
MATTILQAKAVIEAEDRTAAVFKGIQERMAAIGRTAAEVSAVHARVTGSASQAAGAANSLGGGLSHMASGITAMAAAAAGFATAVGATKLAIDGVHAAASRLHEAQRELSAGMSKDEIAESQRRAAEIHANMPSVGTTETMHTIRNARSIVGSQEEALRVAGDISKLRVIAQAANPGADVSGDLDQLLKGIEIEGGTQDPAKFHRMMEGIAKGLNAFGDTLKPYQYYEMFKYGRQATPGLSEEFIMSTAPSLAQSLSGSSYGKAVSAFNASLIGGVMKHSAFKEYANLGLIAPGDIDYTKTGEAKGFKPGAHIQGWRRAQDNPYSWTSEYLIPALEKHGITSKEDQLALIPRLFQNQQAGQLVGEMVTQRSRIEKDREMWRAAEGLGSAERLQREDPTIVWQGLKQSVDSLGGTLFSGLVRDFSGPIAHFSESVARFDAAVQRSPSVYEGWKDYVSKGWSRVGDGLKEYAGLGPHWTGATPGEALDKELPKINRSYADYLAKRDKDRRLDAALSGWGLSGAEDQARRREATYAEIDAAHGARMAAQMAARGADVAAFMRKAGTSSSIDLSGDALRNHPLPIGGPAKAELTGAADVRLQVEVTTDTQSIVRQVVSYIQATGALRPADTGMSMPETTPNAWRGE